MPGLVMICIYSAFVLHFLCILQLFSSLYVYVLPFLKIPPNFIQISEVQQVKLLTDVIL